MRACDRAALVLTSVALQRRAPLMMTSAPVAPVTRTPPTGGDHPVRPHVRPTRGKYRSRWSVLRGERFRGRMSRAGSVCTLPTPGLHSPRSFVLFFAYLSSCPCSALVMLHFTYGTRGVETVGIHIFVHTFHILSIFIRAPLLPCSVSVTFRSTDGDDPRTLPLADAPIHSRGVSRTFRFPRVPFRSRSGLLTGTFHASCLWLMFRFTDEAFHTHS